VNLRRLHTRAGVLSATEDHPYSRFATAASPVVTGLTDEAGAAIWVGEGPFGLVGHGVGPWPAVTALFDRARDLVSGAVWVNLPRHDRAPSGYQLREAWDLRWCTQLPAPRPYEDLVEEITDDDEVNALLDVAYPHTEARPGSTLARRFYGIRWGGRLVACACDRSSPYPHEPGQSVGVIGAVAVHPDHRRGGLGAAVTAALTRQLATTHALVALGQVADNEAATLLYAQLGYTGVQRITSVRNA
jgi:ribosomal protein S18 acetylase RimI-like enzyme